jgi:hypothetical protein
MDFLIGLDLGQVNAPTALVIVEVQWPTTAEARPTYQVRHIERMLGWPYPRVVEQVVGRLAQLPYPQQRWLAADATGVGRPVIDMLMQAKLDPVSLTIHGGDQLHQEGRSYRVPKRDVVSALQVTLQTGRLNIASQLPLSQTLVDELLAFRVRIDLGTGHDSYSAWREKDHDDLGLATAMAIWLGEWLAKTRPPPVLMERALMRTPRQAPGAGLGGALRPRYDRPRLYDGVMDETPQDVDWDEAKNRMSRGEVDVRRPLRPERRPG